jgi:hypothetical protein
MGDNRTHVNYRRMLLVASVATLFFFMLHAVALFNTLHDIESSLLLGLLVGGVYGMLAFVLSFIWPEKFFHRR